MKRVTLTLLAFAAATTACSSAFAAGQKEERFVLSSAAEPAHRTDNTAAVASVMPSTEKKDEVFTIGLEALKWVGATSRQVGVPYPDLWCADFINFILRRTGHATTNSRAAKSFLDYGKRIDSPRVGAIVVLAARHEQRVGAIVVLQRGSTMATSASCAAPTAPATSSSSREITGTRCGKAHTRKAACWDTSYRQDRTDPWFRLLACQLRRLLKCSRRIFLSSLRLSSQG